MSEKTVQAASCVQEGPLAKFGPSTFFGLKGIKPRFIDSKLSWQEGEVYDSNLIEKTQERLLKSELFSSVYITHGEELDERGELPIKIRVSEAKHQRISVGGFYGTVDGPGFTFAWSHRNIGGMGDILSAKGDVSKRFIAGNITYKKPDFLTFDQTYRAFGELSRENIRAYLSFSYRFAQYIDRKIDPKTNVSAGMKLEHINVLQFRVERHLPRPRHPSFHPLRQCRQCARSDSGHFNRLFSNALPVVLPFNQTLRQTALNHLLLRSNRHPETRFCIPHPIRIGRRSQTGKYPSSQTLSRRLRKRIARIPL